MFAREWRTVKAYHHVRGGSHHESFLKGEPLGRTSNPHETAILSGCGLFGVVYYSSCSVNYCKTYTNKVILSVCVHIMCACMLSHFSCVWLFGTLRTVARQTHLSIGISRQEYWNGFVCPPSGNLPDPDIQAMSLMPSALAGGFFTISGTWEAHILHTHTHIYIMYVYKCLYIYNYHICL